MNKHQYQVIIVGGGHAGTEAALAAARMGMRTLLLSHNIETLGQMSCNPAIGGIGKSHLVKEIDALGGIMATAADHAGIHWRTLNASKGPAVRATRAQADRILYKAFVRQALEQQENLHIFQQAVDDLIIENNQVKGIITQMGLQFFAPTVVLTTGTFLAGKIHIGLKNYAGGRAGDPPALSLAEKLRALPFRVDRLKTGTPPRIDGRTIDYSVLSAQPSESPLPVMSYLGNSNEHPQQVSCFIAKTNEQTHDIIRAGLDRSPMYSGVIEGVGPRYCPSIEDKVVRFAQRGSHQIFLEPEGLNTPEIYPNGISTSLPYDVQEAFVRSIKGLENCHITRPGYAIEYDFFDPRDLSASLETKYINGLFFAGQINGTTGYEEAAAQGLIAGINAALKIKKEALWTPTREESYIGVLIDDLITRGTKEPYRMFTSRAEYRLMLREDNADLRLTEKGWQIGCVDEKRWQHLNAKRAAIAGEHTRLKNIYLHPATDDAKKFMEKFQQEIEREYNGVELLRRPEVTYAELTSIERFAPGVDATAVALQVETQIKYAGYIEKQLKEIEKHKYYQEAGIPQQMDYDQILGLSNEVKLKLKEIRPTSIAQAGRISGVTPAAISILLVHLKKVEKSKV